MGPKCSREKWSSLVDSQWSASAADISINIRQAEMTGIPWGTGTLPAMEKGNTPAGAQEGISQRGVGC